MKKTILLILGIALVSLLAFAGNVEADSMILPITNKVGDFVDGEVVTGQTSGATGYVRFHLGVLCQGEVNPSNVVSPLKFKLVFEPWGTPPGENALGLIQVEGTFQQGEQIVGATSGATADVSPSHYVYHSRILIDPNHVAKMGDSCGAGYSCDAAWDIYLNNPTYETRYIVYDWAGMLTLRCHECYPCGGEPKLGRCAVGLKYYLKFNTSGADPNPISAKLRLKVHNVWVEAGLDNPTLRVYSQDWGDIVDISDWDGGVLQASRVISESDEGTTIELDVDLESVNIGGDSKYKLSQKEIDDNTVLKNGQQCLWIWLKYEKLILGYNKYLPVKTATHYQIQVNTKADFTGDEMWDSAKTPFDTPVNENVRSEDIPYAGSELQAETKYWWRGKLWDNEGIEGDWSEEEAYFIMGEQEEAQPIVSFMG